MKEFKRALNLTWEAIAFDILEISPNQTVEQEDLISIVMDYIEPYGELSKEQLAQWQKLSYEEKIAIAKEAFPSKLYGM